MKVKNLNFEEFRFNHNRRLLHTKRKYSNGKVIANMQIDASSTYNNIKIFHIEIIIQHRLPNGELEVNTQSAFFNSQFNQVRRDTCFSKAEHKDYIEKKYMPWVISSIELFKEANQDLYPQD